MLILRNSWLKISLHWIGLRAEFENSTTVSTSLPSLLVLSESLEAKKAHLDISINYTDTLRPKIREH